MIMQLRIAQFLEVENRPSIKMIYSIKYYTREFLK